MQRDFMHTSTLLQMPRSARRLGAALVVALAAACGGGGGGGGGTTNPPPTQTLGSITATPTTMNLAGGETAKITASAKDTQGGTIAGVQGFSYTSDAPAVADVSSSGNVIGLSTGNATITVSLTRDGVTKTATVAVTVAGGLPTTAEFSTGATTFSPTQVAVATGGTVTYRIGSVTHNVTFDTRNGAPPNIPNSTNVSVDRVFNTAGNFDFTCTLHAGMDGTVVVR